MRKIDYQGYFLKPRWWRSIIAAVARHSLDVLLFCTGFANSNIVRVAAEAAEVMPGSGRASIAPLVASGTDSKSSKVRGPIS